MCSLLLTPFWFRGQECINERCKRSYVLPLTCLGQFGHHALMLEWKWLVFSEFRWANVFPLILGILSQNVILAILKGYLVWFTYTVCTELNSSVIMSVSLTVLTHHSISILKCLKEIFFPLVKNNRNVEAGWLSCLRFSSVQLRSPCWKCAGEELLLPCECVKQAIGCLNSGEGSALQWLFLLQCGG